MSEETEYPAHVTEAWAEWARQSQGLRVWDLLTEEQRQRFADVTGVAIRRYVDDAAAAAGIPEHDAKPGPRRLTVTPASYGTDTRLLASGWQRGEDHALTVTSDGAPVAEFAPGAWSAVIDEDCRDPDVLKAARDGLTEIRHAVRQATGLTSEDGDELWGILRKVDLLADAAYSASYAQDGDPF